MSGQYPGNYNNPVGSHRGNFSNQQQQMVNMNQMVQNQMGMMGGYNQNVVVSGVGGGMMSQQQQNPMSGIGQPVMNASGMQAVSPIHQQQGPSPQALIVQQQIQQQQLQQQQLQQQQQMPPQPPQPQQSNVGPVGQSTQLSLQTTSNQPVTGGSIMQQPNLPHSMAQPSNMLGITQPLPHKEINIVALSRLGQETVQDITSRFQEIFAALKIVQPTLSNRESSAEKKVQEYLRTIRLLFKRVRIIYEKCNDGYPQGLVKWFCCISKVNSIYFQEWSTHMWKV